MTRQFVIATVLLFTASRLRAGNWGCSMRKLTAALVLVVAGCSMSADTRVAEEAVARFHAMLDAAQFEAIYAESADDLKQVATQEKLIDLLEAVHRKLGPMKSSVKQTWNVNYHTSGTFITLIYATIFQGGDAHEQFVYRLQGADAKLAGYHINSDALLLK
jgi:hypothetical protein